MYVLYGGGTSRALIVQMVLEEGEIPYELKTVDIANGEHQSPEYLTINPTGRVPALITHDGTALFEAAAIAIYLAEEHHMYELMPPPGNPLRHLFFSRLFFLTNDVQPAVRRFFLPNQYTDDARCDIHIRRKARDAAMDRWAVLDRMLERNGPYNLGESISLVDFYMAYWAADGLEHPETVIEAFPHIHRCFSLVSDRPKIRPLIDAFQTEMKNWDRSVSS